MNLNSYSESHFESHSESKGNVLLVDELPGELRALSEILVNLGYTTRIVTGASMALKAVKTNHPDVILVDILMPKMEGYQTCQLLNRDPNCDGIPILLALENTFDHAKAFAQGCADSISKPFQTEEIFARLETQVTIQKQRRRLQAEIAQRQEIEEDLVQTKALISSILNSSLDGIASLQAVRDPIIGSIKDFRCITINPMMSKMIDPHQGNSQGELFVRNTFGSFTPNLFERFVTVVEFGVPLAEDFHSPSDNPSWFHYTAVKLGDGLVITIRDITRQKHIENQFNDALHKLELLNDLDDLTQVANRRRFEEYLGIEWQRHQREKNPIALLLIAIDHFQLYTERYGDPMAEDCLFRIAQTIAQIPKRPGDLIARYKGEEFAVILCNTNIEGAVKIANLIQAAIEILDIPHEGLQISNRITLSIGLTSLTPNLIHTTEKLIYQASQALYTAQKMGHNRTITM